MRLPDEALERLLREGKSFRVKTKRSLDGDARNAIGEAICAFANDLPGAGEPGVMFVGVQDQQLAPSGFVPDEAALQTLMAMKTDGRMSPAPSMLVEKRTVAGMQLAVVTVEPSPSPPVRFRGRIHVRTGPRRGIATAQDERILNERRRHLDLPFDARPLVGVPPNSLNISMFKEECLPSAFDPEMPEINEGSVQERLAALKMVASADDPTPTVLGMMTLGRMPLDYLPNFFVQFLRIDGTDRADQEIDERRIDGRLSEIVRGIDEKILAAVTVGADICGADRKIRKSGYPVPALQQLIRNAIMHRSYEATNAPTRVTWYQDRVEIQSPGGPFGQVTKENFGRPGIADYRNPNLADAMKTFGYVKRFGAGISTASALLAEAGLPVPEFRVEDSHVLAVVRGARP